MSDLDQLRDLAREFFARESTPHQKRFAEQGHVDRDLWRRAGAAGLLCLSVPEAYGGGGGTFAHEAVVLEEQARAMDSSFGNAVHSGIVAHYLLAYGTEEQKLRWLPGLASGELVGAIAMTEPGTGSDLQAVATRAVRDGDEYVLDGSKMFITNGYLCDLVIVVAQCEGGLSLLVVESPGTCTEGAPLPGFTRGQPLRKIGMHGQDTCELAFSAVRVPVGHLLGDEGDGMAQLMTQLPQERLIIAVSAVAVIEAVLAVTIDYTKGRDAFGRKIFTFQNTRFTLAECATAARIARVFVDDCVRAHLAGELDLQTAAMAKYWTTEQQCTIVDACLQLFGGYGYMAEYPISQAYVDSRVQKIYGGTNEIMKELIARFL
ncbi:putative acyl CoA dehydrogenase [Longispora fulva]|uniref:Acyl-CoA dehydrogenase n=1 Tax=Longispora fulva TaxID=619741 RepID=A0A8J7GJI4_9ACTN|nr:acyl-CoA dehydrogenase family protein [Longispora fulva]MBG6137932.1 acyl-CoA dehydrogenase [Longispora fulva]GIG60185.1 putative acyl CoA dehydrogenase [Longispora fulva]